VTVSVNKYKSKTARSESAPTELEPLAFEGVFQAHWPRVYAVIYRIVGDPAEAEDLALETFLRLHQRPPRDRTNLPGWLYRVATNLGLNALRARKRREQYETEAGVITLEGQPPANPGMAAEQAEERRRVRQVLSRMKKRSAKILILRHSGFSYAEVAGVVGVSPNSVGTLLARAEREFERRYRESEGEDYG
jgi:RNA polymerase sigma-70 factor (ECF subfamily)